MQRCDYTSDLFSHLQISRDWFYGKPMFYENSFGRHNLIHSYFFDILLSPLTIPFGVYGLFIAECGLTAIAVVAVLRYFQKTGVSLFTQVLFTCMVCSPVTYFTLHDIHYGFHAEIMLLPLGMLLGLALLQRSLWAIVPAICIILVKEDAAVFLCSLLLMVQVYHLSAQKITVKQLLWRGAGIIAVCIGILLLGLWWIHFQNRNSEARSESILLVLQQSKVTDILHSFFYLLFLRAQLTIPILLLIYFYAGPRYLVLAMLGAFPVLMVNFLSGSLYRTDTSFWIDNPFSLLWCPRFAVYWAYWIAVLFMALLFPPKKVLYPSFAKAFLLPIYCIGLFWYQLYFFAHNKVYTVDLAGMIGEAFIPNVEFELNPDFKHAAAIARQLPDRYPVAPMYRVFGAFHRLDIVWLNAWDKAYTSPRMILASYNKEEVPEMKYLLKKPCFLLYDRLYIFTEAEDTVYVRKAGIPGEWKLLFTP